MWMTIPFFFECIINAMDTSKQKLSVAQLKFNIIVMWWHTRRSKSTLTYCTVAGHRLTTTNNKKSKTEWKIIESEEQRLRILCICKSDRLIWSHCVLHDALDSYTFNKYLSKCSTTVSCIVNSFASQYLLFLPSCFVYALPIVLSLHIF